jgi:IS1 family transposase
MNFEQIPLVVTDGFGFYEKVVRRVFGPACLYGRVIKTRRNDCIVKVERRVVLGDKWRLEQALQDSEDSVKLNTSFVERLNLTIRQGSAYLGRRTISHARCKKTLEDQLELLRCYYNFVRPHRALRFGREVRTPARQAGLTQRGLTLREIFSSTLLLVASKHVIFALFETARLVSFPSRGVRLAAEQQLVTEAPFQALSDHLLVLLGIVGPQPVLCRSRLRRFSHKSVY